MSTIKAKAFQHPASTSNNITFNADGTHTVNATTVNAVYPLMSKNLLINGGMNIWQRSTNATGVNTSGYHSADRWSHGTNDLLGGPLGTWTQSRSTDVPSAQGFSYSLKMDCTTADASPAADDYLLFQQKLEGQNLQHLLKGTSSAKKVTLSFWVKSNKTGTYIAELYDVDNQRQISQSYTIDSASTWEKKELTFDGDTNATDVFGNDNGWSLGVNWWLGSGSTYSSGTLNTTWNNNTNANRAVGGVNLGDSTSNEWYITGCQLEVGDSATQFEYEPYQVTDLRCRRYYDVRTGEHEGCRNYNNGGLITHVYCTCGSWRTSPGTTYYNTSGGGTWVTYLGSPYSFLATNGGINVLKKASIKIDAEL